jgi:hypothetical protein
VVLGCEGGVPGVVVFRAAKHEATAADGEERGEGGLGVRGWEEDAGQRLVEIHGTRF